MFAELQALAVIGGALVRRGWGGWFNLPKAAKFIIVAGAVAASAALATGNLLATALVALPAAASVLFAKGHGWSHGVGRVEGRPLGQCIVTLWGNYATATGVGGIGWYLAAGDVAGLIYAPMGFLVPVGYILAQWFNDIFKPNWAPADQSRFADGTTIIGELILGALLLSGANIANLIKHTLEAL